MPCTTGQPLCSPAERWSLAHRHHPANNPLWANSDLGLFNNNNCQPIKIGDHFSVNDTLLYLSKLLKCSRLSQS